MWVMIRAKAGDKIYVSGTLGKEYCTQNEAMKLALTAGDDYELCFTVPPQEESKLVARLKEEKISCCCIGEIKESLGVHLLGYSDSLSEHGFQHFV
jgi:thiamine-monophosphate kinase